MKFNKREMEDKLNQQQQQQRYFNIAFVYSPQPKLAV